MSEVLPPVPRDPDLDQLQAQLRAFCELQGRTEAAAFARTAFDEAIFWLRSHRDRERVMKDINT